MPTMMEHPIHGRHSASAGEMPRMLENGWTVMPPKNAAIVDAPPKQVEVTPQEPRQKRKYTRRQGT